MNAAPAELDRIQVASPCGVAWESMQGDDRVRYCGECRLSVYDLSAMGREEAETLVQEREGRLCVRFYRRRDGTVLTQDCPVGFGKVRRLFFSHAAVCLGVFALLPGIVPWAQKVKASSIWQREPYKQLADVLWPQPPIVNIAIMGDVVSWPPSPAPPTSQIPTP